MSETKEVQTQDMVPSCVADDDIIAIAEQAEARIKAVMKIKQTALMVTNVQDWTDQAGKPYMMASAAEKIANLFNISWKFLSPEPTKQNDVDGHYTYTYSAEFSMGTRSIQVDGSRSSKDGFFSQYDYVQKGEKKERVEKAVHDRDNERDVKMAAYTNLLGNGITRILGMRNLTWEDLEKFAKIRKAEVSSVQYKKSGEKQEKKHEEPQSDPATGEPLGDSTQPQHGAIFAILKKLGIEDELAKHEAVSKALGLTHTITSMKVLTKAQASKAIELLGSRFNEAEKK